MICRLEQLQKVHVKISPLRSSRDKKLLKTKILSAAHFLDILIPLSGR